MANNRRKSTFKNFVYGEAQDGSDQVIPISAVVLPEYQPRQYFDEQKLEEMVLSIKSQGLLSRLIVRRISGTDSYELVAGGRRFRAAKKAGLIEVPVIVKKLTDDEALEIAITENLQREDLNPLEETEGILRLLSSKLGISSQEVPQLLVKMYNDSKRKDESEQNVLFTKEGNDVQAIFVSLGTMQWESFVTSRLPLLNLPKEILEVLRSGKLSYTKAQTISRIKDIKLRKRILSEAVKKNLSLNQIKARISELKQKSIPEQIEDSPKNRISNTYRKVMKTKVWSDPKKWKKLEKLLSQIDLILDE